MRRAPLFDTYLMVDWSAASVPTRGKDSIWLCQLRREEDGLHERLIANPATRHEARQALLALLRQERATGRAVLAGFDFAFGYPRGLAARLQLAGPPWRALWDFIAERLVDGAGNANNRFALAADLNRRISGGPGPFWGCPARQAGPCLGVLHHRRHAEIGLAERRLADAYIRGPQPVWKLAYTGSVGSQALTGIPVLRWLRDHADLAAATRVWPFETGLAPLSRGKTRGGIVLAEVYPSLVPLQRRDGEVKDAAQVRAIAHHFATLDGSGRLGDIFAGDPRLDREERRAIEQEESWILGVTAPQASTVAKKEVPTIVSAARSAGAMAAPRVTDADAIYRESFRLVRESVDLARFPDELRPLVLRLVHALAEPAIAADLHWSEGAAAAGRAALRAGVPVLVDARMVAAGITEARLPARNRILCTLRDRRVPKLASRLATTRSAAAVELWRAHLDGAVVAIGNAPTALFHLLDMVAAGAPRPALVLGFPVGFVGATEAKQALAENRLGLAFVTLAGRRGGSALAAAAVNALARDEPAA